MKSNVREGEENLIFMKTKSKYAVVVIILMCMMFLPGCGKKEDSTAKQFLKIYYSPTGGERYAAKMDKLEAYTKLVEDGKTPEEEPNLMEEYDSVYQEMFTEKRYGTFSVNPTITELDQEAFEKDQEIVLKSMTEESDKTTESSRTYQVKVEYHLQDETENRIATWYITTVLEEKTEKIDSIRVVVE